jgi:alpha-tubulin suppressor-like RCC1 family protein
MDDEIEDIRIFSNGVKCPKVVIGKMYSTMDIDRLINTIFRGEKRYESVGIAYHNNPKPKDLRAPEASLYPKYVLPMFNNETLREIGPLFDYFIRGLKGNGVKRIDLITCYIEEENVKRNIWNLSNRYGIEIGYSVDATGSSEGGDWIMESDGMDIKGVYFNDGINEYRHILGGISGSQGRSSSGYVTASGKVMVCGYNGYGNLGIGNTTTPITTYTNVSSLDTSNVVSLCMTSILTAFLTEDGKVYKSGLHRATGGNLTTPTIISNDISNIVEIGTTTEAIFMRDINGDVFVHGRTAGIDENSSELGLGNTTIVDTGYAKVEDISRVRRMYTGKGIIFYKVGDDGNGTYQTEYNVDEAIFATGIIEFSTNNTNVFEYSPGVTKTKTIKRLFDSTFHVQDLSYGAWMTNVNNIAVGDNHILICTGVPGGSVGGVYAYGKNRRGQCGIQQGFDDIEYTVSGKVIEDTSGIISVGALGETSYFIYGEQAEYNHLEAGLNGKVLSCGRNDVDWGTNFMLGRNYGLYGGGTGIPSKVDTISGCIGIGGTRSGPIFYCWDGKYYGCGINENGSLGIPGHTGSLITSVTDLSLQAGHVIQGLNNVDYESLADTFLGEHTDYTTSRTQNEIKELTISRYSTSIAPKVANKIRSQFIGGVLGGTVSIETTSPNNYNWITNKVNTLNFNTITDVKHITLQRGGNYGVVLDNTCFYSTNIIYIDLVSRLDSLIQLEDSLANTILLRRAPGGLLEVDGTNTPIDGIVKRLGDTITLGGKTLTIVFISSIGLQGNLSSAPCIHPDMKIMISNGDKINRKRIGDVKEGEIVYSVYGPTRVEKKIEFTARLEENAPYIIKRGCIGDGVPAEDLIISPKHHILVGNHMISAEKLSKLLPEGYSERELKKEEGYKYVHLHLENGSLMNVNGMWVHSNVRDIEEGKEY